MDTFSTFNPFDWGFHTWRAIFAIVGGFSLLVALPGFVAPRTGLRAFWGNISLRTAPAVKQWCLNFLLVLVALGYLLVAWKLPSFLWVLVIGVAVKLAFMATVLRFHLHGKNSDLMAVIALFEAVMVGFTILYLITGPRVSDFY